jgi:ATP-binding cassette subfamily F protein uup
MTANSASKAAAAGERAEAKASQKSGSGGAKRRLSFNEKHALEALPAKIAQLEKDIASLQRRLADPDLYSKDRKAFDRISASLVQAQNDLREAENRWLELELLRENLANQTS